MFADWFKRVFGIGSAIVATLALAVAAIAAGVWLVQAVNNPRSEIEARLASFKQLCAIREQGGPWMKYDDVPPPPEGFVPSSEYDEYKRNAAYRRRIDTLLALEEACKGLER